MQAKGQAAQLSWPSLTAACADSVLLLLASRRDCHLVGGMALLLGDAA
jgi:hypothetical protein